MIRNFLKGYFKTTLTLLVSLFFLVALGACSKKATFLNSSVVPGAKGAASVSKDRNKNYVIKVDLTDLADPSRLQPSREMYIVWMETDNNLTRNIGQIKTSSSMFSKRMKSTFQTISSFKPTRIFITAEDDSDVQYPRNEVVMTTSNF